MTNLTPAAFGEYFEALHGYRPFRWQQRLADQVTSGDWPRALALPTASGKTACIDIAVFALAFQARSENWPDGRRTAPRRVFFVVDRRVIVDEAFDRAIRIARKLRDAKDGVLRLVADHLRAHAGAGAEEIPLQCAQLRGGIYRDQAWAKSPIQPTVICSTVDQIGSRLLFRGYGVGWGTRVVHAGLAANDSLVILDEAHCAKPFYQTGESIRRYREWCDPDHRLAAPFHFTVMSATPPAEIPADTVFPSPDIWAADLNQPDQHRLARRVRASKRATLIEPVKDRNPRSTERLVARLAETAVSFVDDEHRRIGIMVNRVATAKAVYKFLQDQAEDVILLTGRMRGIDRDETLGRWKPAGHDAVEGLADWFPVSDESDKSRPALDHPVFVVATQCLEVGANLDFDALVTECASLDALRQRFGRLNRAGRVMPARAAVVMRADLVDPVDPDPVYGASITETWKWLVEMANEGAVDFGIEAFEALLPPVGAERTELLGRLNMPSDDAPVMLPAHLDCWVQTAPAPAADPDPAAFLHGPQRDLPEVQVCVREDLTQVRDWAEDWIETLSFCPPSIAECLAVPLPYLRRWMRGRVAAAAELADIETPSVTLDDEDVATVLPRAVIWRGPNDSKPWTDERDLRPGDVVVFPGRNPGVPTADGANPAASPQTAESERPTVLDDFGHVPRRENAVPRLDCGDEANFAARGKAVLRLHPALLDHSERWRFSVERTEKAELLELLQSDSPEDLLVGEFRRVLGATLDSGQVGAALQPVVRAIVTSRRRPRLSVHPCSGADAGNRLGGVILIAPGRVRRDPLVDEETFTNEDDSSSMTREISLPQHLAGVAEMASRFASACLPSNVVTDFRLAAQWHDAGKADQRFQAWLRGGDPLLTRFARELLAKSAGSSNRAARERARMRSGYPKGARHELVSLRLLEHAPAHLSKAADPDLVLHLIAAHHGHCRPFPPVVFDESPVEVTHISNGDAVTVSSATGLERIDSGVSDRYWRLVRKYGWWGLAWLEAMFVLADHRQSEAEQQEEDT